MDTQPRKATNCALAAALVFSALAAGVWASPSSPTAPRGAARASAAPRLAGNPGAATAAGQALPLAERLAWQIALDRVGFSAGIIDGKTGSKIALATREFQAAHGLPSTGRLDAATSAALRTSARRISTASYPPCR